MIVRGRRHAPRAVRRVVAVVPTLNEAPGVARCIRALWAAGCAAIVVADGDSTDNTAARAAAAGATVVHAPRGRGQQLAAGCAAAAAAGADVVWLVHADTLVPSGGVRDIQRAFRAGACCGAFPLVFDRAGPVLQASAVFTRLPVRRWVFGDRAPFFCTDALAAIGGVPALPVMEDVALTRAARALPHAWLDTPVVTSARRYARGELVQQVRNAALLAALSLGVPPAHLARQYPAHRA